MPPRTALTVDRISRRKMTHSLATAQGAAVYASVPVVLSQTSFVVETWVYRSTTTLEPNEALFGNSGNASVQRQGTNDVQAYAYLNAPADYATPRRLRFRNLGRANFLGWTHRIYHFYVGSDGHAYCQEYVNGVAFQTPRTVDYAGDPNTPDGTLYIAGGHGSSTFSFNGNMTRVRFYNDIPVTEALAEAAYKYGTPLGTIYKEFLNSPQTDGAGTVLADSMGGSAGTVTSTIWSTNVPLDLPVALPEKMPHVLKFDGVDDVVSATAIADFASGGVVQWKGVLKDIQTAQGLVGNTTGGSDRFSLHVFAGEVRFGYYNGSDFVGKTSSNKIYTNSPIDIVATFDGTNSRIFINGNEASTGTTSTSTSSTVGLAFGAKSSLTELLNGNQTAVRIWTGTALTPTEIYNLHHHNIIPETGLVGNWDRISDDGTQLLDSVGGNHGTITGATRVTEPLALGSMPRKQRVPYVGSVEFDGVDDYTQVDADTTLNVGAEVTVVTEFMLTSLANVNASPFRGGADEYGFLMSQVSGGNKIEFKVTRETDITQYGSSTGGIVLGVGKWYQVVGTAKAGEPVRKYVNGIKDLDNETLPADDIIRNVVSWLAIGKEGAASRFFPGYIAQTRVYKKKLTTAEVENFYLTNQTPYDNDPSICVLNLEAKTDVLSGSTWRDVSGNNNHGAITGATLSSEAPSKARKQRDGNLVDFTAQPYMVAAQTASNWIDGTATGSATATPFGLRKYNVATAFESSFVRKDGRNCILLSATNVTGRGYVDLGVGIGASAPYWEHKDRLAKLTPGGTYRISGYIKTDNVPTDGAFLQLTTYTGDGTRVDNIPSDTLTGTNDWTYISKEITVSATAVLGDFGIMKNIAGSISDAWFDIDSLRFEKL